MPKAFDLATYVTGSLEETEAYTNWLFARANGLIEQPIHWAAVEALATELLKRLAVLERELSGVRQAADAAPGCPEGPSAPGPTAQTAEPTTASGPPAEPPPPLAPDPLPTTDGRQPWWQRLLRPAVVL